MTETDDILTFRDLIRNMVPRWMRSGTIGKVMYAIGVHADAVGDAAYAAVRKRAPEADSEDAAGLIAEDRRMIRGPNETWDAFRARLRGWRQAHQTRGNPYQLLQQLHATTLGAFAIELYYYGTAKTSFAMDLAGDITRGISDTAGFDVGHWLLIYAWPDELIDDGEWDDPGEWDDGGVWDSDMTPQEIADLRRVPSAWNAAHAIGHLKLLHSPTMTSLEISVD